MHIFQFTFTLAAHHIAPRVRKRGIHQTCDAGTHDSTPMPQTADDESILPASAGHQGAYDSHPTCPMSRAAKEVEKCQHQLQEYVLHYVQENMRTREHGELQLSSTPASHYYLNPNVPETRQILDVYNELLGPAPLLAIQPAPVQNLEGGELGNRVSLKTLLGTNPEIQQGARFTVEARLARIDTTNRQCHEYGTQPIPNYKYLKS